MMIMMISYFSEYQKKPVSGEKNATYVVIKCIFVSKRDFKHVWEVQSKLLFSLTFSDNLPSSFYI